MNTMYIVNMEYINIKNKYQYKSHSYEAMQPCATLTRTSPTFPFHFEVRFLIVLI